MNAFELFNEHGKPCGVWCCGKCRKLVLSPIWHPTSLEPRSTKEAAEKCCTPHLCECGKEITQAYSHECGACQSTRWSRESRERYERRLTTAEDVTATYDGPVCLEHGSPCTGDMGDAYFSSASFAAECVEDSDDCDVDGELWAFACRASVQRLNINDVVERLCEDGYEDMADHVTIPKSLRDEVDKFNELNERVLTCWEVDHKRKVKITTSHLRPGRE